MAGAQKKKAQKERQAAKAQGPQGDGQPMHQQPERSTAGSTQPPLAQSMRAMSGFDGPGESSSAAPLSRGRSGSHATPSVGQPPRGTSQTRSSSQIRGTSSNMLPDRDAHRYAARFIDLPGNAYVYGGLQDKVYADYKCMPRPTELKVGKPASVAINSHRITKFPTFKIYQYDVSIGRGDEKRGLIKKIWNSPQVQQKFPPGVIFDGNKLAWHKADVTAGRGEIRITVDLDQDQPNPRPRREKAPSNTFPVTIKRTTEFHLSDLQAYLSGQTDLSNKIIDAVTFLDHLLRETPSHTHISLRRSFFDRLTNQRASLGFGVEAMKGVYQSIRFAQGGRLVVNVDVSNAVFWNESPLISVAMHVTGCNSHQDLAQKAKKVKSAIDKPFQESNAMLQMRKLKKNDFRVKHKDRSEREQAKIWTIKAIIPENAREYKFKLKDRTTGQEGQEVTIEQYYLRRYNIPLQYPLLPLVEATKKGVVYPMEFCHLEKGQRYPYKLNEEQTASMIKFAVERPTQRKASINAGLKLLNWSEDKVLHDYGLQIDAKQLATTAHVLDPPSILFGKGNKVNPGFSGRWDLKGKQFLLPNNAPLFSWGVCVIAGRNSPNTGVVDNFIKSFVQAYKNHGGIVQTAQPHVHSTNIGDIGKVVETLFYGTGNQFKHRPQMFVFILPDKNADVYMRIKKSCDCRFGIVSQCMQGAQVSKNNPQYHSNVCMKFNAKLGGTTSKTLVKGSREPMAGFFTQPTMIIGADVSHAAPGANNPSMAAMTMSLDKYASRYAAACQTNPHRVEMITSHNIDSMMKPLFNHWAQNVGGGHLPSHVYYFRDGVSAAQYGNVMLYEVAALKALLQEIGKSNKEYKVQFTVIVAEKRHHIRFFPAPGTMAADKNGNPVPGVVVDQDVTHPYEFDFYLNSHSAIQGTARPTHYQVIADEAKVNPNQLVTMIYEHSYQYMRSTTPVSLFPAVYYAHLASNRARAHENVSYAAQVKEASGEETSSEKKATEAPKLLPMEETNKINFTMWYI